MAYPQTATSGSGTYTQASSLPVTPISPMQEARQALTGSVNLLHERLGELERRLESVLRPDSPPTPNTGNSKIETAPSEHRQFLAATASEIDAVSSRIGGLLHRIEL
jgi:hypothetical protein